MKAERRHFLIDLLSSRSRLIEFIVGSVFLAVGVNLAAAVIPSFLSLKTNSVGLLAILLILISLALLFLSLFSRGSYSRTFQGFFLYSRDNNELIDIPRYRFSRDLNSYLKAALAENHALKIIWEKEPLKNIWVNAMLKGEGQHVGDIKDFLKNAQGSSRLICEAVEYYVLSSLSVHLTDYFNDPRFDKENLKELRREDVPDILFRNRLFEMFSRPMDQRPHFVDLLSENKKRGEIVFSYGRDSSLFQKFDLVLPINTVVSRSSENCIKLETDRFIIILKINFYGTSTLMPKGFVNHYLSIDNIEGLHPFQIFVNVDIQFKWWALLTRSGWHYYHWVDSFIEFSERSISKDAFFEQINWSTALTILECLNIKEMPTLGKQT